MPVQVLPAAEAASLPAVRQMLLQASHDRELCDATYLPYGLESADVERWASDHRAAWVVLDNEVPVGWWEVQPLKDSCGFALPPGTWEREVWLLPEARGRRLIQQATELLLPGLISRGVTHLAGIAWSDNSSSIQGMRNAGFEILGQGWWGEPPNGGWCVVGLLSIGSD